MQKVVRLLSLLILLTFDSLNPLAASAAASSLVKAEAAYSAGDFEESTKLYLERTLDEATTSPNASIFHNLGLSFERKKELGLAVASYLRAVQLEPRQADFQYNLRFLLNQSSDKLDAEFPKDALRTLWSWPAKGSERELFYASLISLAILISLLCFVVLRPSFRSSGIWLSLVASFLLLFFSSGLTYKLFGENDVGAVVAQKIEVYSGPTESVVIFELHQGAPFQILNSSGDWVKIGLSDQKQGWVKKSGVASFGRDTVLLPGEWKQAS